MLPSQMAELVTEISQVDGRIRPTEGTVTMWFATIGDLDYGDAHDAVIAHYGRATSADWAMQPGDVRAGVEKIRAARRAAMPRVEDLMADVDLDDPDYQRIWRDRTEAALARPATPAPRATITRS